MARQSENGEHLRSHDYAHLAARWRSVAAREGWAVSEIARAGDFPVLAVESGPRRPGAPRLYLSAGIHGDEPASTEGLLAWAQKRARDLRRCEFLIFPCLNPWGLQHNSRYDSTGRDLNRGYHRHDVPVIEAQKRLLRGRKFDAALMLHEDYDARGVYLYEIPGARPFWGEKLLAAAARHVPREPRAKVEGRRCRRGVIRTRLRRDTLPEHPEAIYLRFGHSPRTITFETPSEFSMAARVAAQGAVLDEALRLLG